MLESDLYSMQEQIFRQKFRSAKLLPEKLYGRGLFIRCAFFYLKYSFRVTE